MKIKQLLCAAVLLIGSAGASAQDDVTSTYLTNPSFESCTARTSNLAASASAVGENYADAGWTLAQSSAWCSSAVVAYGGSGQVNGASAPSADNAGNSGNALGVSVGWGGINRYLSTTAVTLPAGHYVLTVNAYNNLSGVTQFKSLNGFVSTSGSSYLSTKTSFTYASWVTDVITFDLTEATEGNFQIGGQAISGGSGSNAKVFFDNITLVYTDPLKASKDALQAEIDKAKLCDAKEGLADAIATAEGVLSSATTTDELDDALATLQAADKDAVLRYENGLADATALAPVLTDFVVNGTFTDNVNGWTATGGFQNSARASNQQGAFTVPFWENWNPSAKVNKMYQTINNIPNGTYRLDIAAFVNTLADPNESQYVFANDDKVYLTTGAPTAYEVYTVVTNNQVEIGLEQTTATANWMGIDNVSLRYYGAGDVINDAKNASHKLAWQEAKAAAEAAVANEDYENVTGAELTALNAEIAKDEPTTAEGYDEAAAALTAATSTFTAAKAAYDGRAALWNAGVPELIYAATEKYTAIGDAYFGEGDVVDAADAEARTAAMKTAIRAYYESHAMAENVEGAVNMTNRITNANNPSNTDGWTWTGDKTIRSNESWTDADGTNNHSYFDGGNWGASSWTTTMSQTISLPAGKFLLTAKGRAATNTTFTMAVGEDKVELPHVSNVGNVFDRGWGDASVEFETDGSDVTILVTATSSTIHEWFSVCDFRLVRLELYTEMAKAEDYEAMATALAAAKAKALGFDKDEYAPYNNTEAIAAITTAEAVDTEAENAKADIEAITTALGNWTVNETEVDAIFDGQFATTAANATSGDINLPGWTKVNGIRLLVKDTDVDPGLAYTYGKAAVFSWGATTLTYGEQAGYTLPLNQHSIYELTFKASAWRDGTYPSWVTVTLDDDVQGEATSVPGKINDAEGNPFRTYTYYLKPTAENSILKIYMNQHFTLADLSLKLAVAEDVTLDENVNYTPAKTYANVTLARTIKADVWNTFVVPFDITNDELKAAFGDEVAVAEFSDAGDSEDDVTVNFNTMETPAITANKPVLLKGNAGTSFTFNGRLIKEGDAKVAGTYVDFVGTYAAETTVKEGDYFINGNKLYKSAGNTTLNGTRAYIDAKNVEEVKLFIDGEDIATSISEINGAAVENGAIYNVAGQRVQKAQKGLYIINGKKVIVK